MFHVEMRMGMQVVREFNLSEQRLWLEFLAPLMAGNDFTVEGHDFIPRQTRLNVYEGPELRTDQLGMGRGWQNVERTATDVTERVLARAREHVAANAASQPGVLSATTPAAASTASAELLRERLIGRLSAGPISSRELLATAAELMPDSDAQQRIATVRQVVWALLEHDAAQLAPPPLSSPRAAGS
ncbi:MAG TPA: hypothetical protein VHU61_00700 [Solirubrobacteraceae bacterium]|jgi:hypothetical protein|nr:hypothetical protein [Solirubrobacteraceae bacterium]